jgi:hypothetical protein
MACASTVISSMRSSSSGSAWRGHGDLLLSGGWVEAVQNHWQAADLAAFQPADRALHAHDGGVIVEFDDGAVDGVQVARGRVVVDPNAVAHVERGEPALAPACPWPALG